MYFSHLRFLGLYHVKMQILFLTWMVFDLFFGRDRGLVVCCKPELQVVLERRKREQTQKEEGEQSRSLLEQVLLKRQQKHHEMMVSRFLKSNTEFKNVVCIRFNDDIATALWGFLFQSIVCFLHLLNFW